MKLEGETVSLESRSGTRRKTITGLPSSTDPTLKLTQTTERERTKQLSINGSSWRGALSLDAYIQREEHLAKQEITRDGGLTSWALVNKLDPGSRSMLCGCETYRKAAIVARKGNVQDVIIHGIGSVFCPKEFRGRGYAQRMVREVGERLKRYQTTESPFSILFSDIGKTFYKAMGWEPFPSKHISLPAVSTAPTTARPLYAADLEELCEIDERQIKRGMARASSHVDSTLVALVPSVQTMRWHHAREEFVGLELLRRRPLVKGAVIGEMGRRTWCYWTRMWYNEDTEKCDGNTLYILRMVTEGQDAVDWENDELNEHEAAERVEAIVALLRAAQEEAYWWSLENIKTWNPNAVTVQAAKMVIDAAHVEEREMDSICSLRWHGDETDRVVWLANEKYGWC